MNNNGDVPILGQPKPSHAVVQMTALVMALDENGLLPLTDGHAMPDDVVTVARLIAMIRDVVREELVRANLVPSEH